MVYPSCPLDTCKLVVFPKFVHCHSRRSSFLFFASLLSVSWSAQEGAVYVCTDQIECFSLIYETANLQKHTHSSTDLHVAGSAAS